MDAEKLIEALVEHVRDELKDILREEIVKEFIEDELLPEFNPDRWAPDDADSRAWAADVTEQIRDAAAAYL